MNPDTFITGDKVCLEIKGVLYDCIIIYQDQIEYQCQSEDRSVLFGKWTSLMFKNDSLISMYGQAKVIQHISCIDI